MITTYNQRSEPVVRLNKNAINIVKYECLECGSMKFIENGVDSQSYCNECGGYIRPLRMADMEEWCKV